jgi:hypothetical protein
MNLKARVAAAVAGLLVPLLAAAALPVDVEILDRETGRVMPVYWHDGERHVAGEPGREYEIRLRNRGGGRLLAVTSVDGVNVITGRTAAALGSGYVLDPRALVAIDGWRKSMDEVAAFYFTALPDSYAARTGRPENVGVIGVALFREVERRAYLDDELARRDEAPAPAAAGAAAESRAAQDAGKVTERDSRLGTGHGRRVDSGARYTEFARASDSPDEVIRIYYDSHRNLVARGVIPRPDRVAWRTPDPFPASFVPDP